MHRLPAAVLILVSVVAVVLCLAEEVRALAACTAADIVAQDPQCPAGSGPCTISSQFDVTPDGCVLDFGERAVTMANGSRLNVEWRTATLIAGSLTLEPKAKILAKGAEASQPGDSGGAVAISTTGDVLLKKGSRSRSLIDASGNMSGGMIIINAGGMVTIEGRLKAAKLSGAADGGDVMVQATGDIIVGSGAEVSVLGGSQGTGGSIDLQAGGDLRVETALDADGGDGGDVFVSARGTVDLSEVRAVGSGDAGYGGSVDIAGGGDVTLLGQVNVKGTGSTTGSGGGDGGTVDVEAAVGDLVVAGRIRASGGFPDGWGGEISLLAGGSVQLQAGADIEADGNGSSSSGGDIFIDAELDIVAGSLLDASGGDAGSVELGAGREVAIAGGVDARGYAAGGIGGEVDLDAGGRGFGSLVVSSVVDAGAGGCGSGVGCGFGGSVVVWACDATVSPSGAMLVRASGHGGMVEITGREQVTVQGEIRADATSSSGIDGTIMFIGPSGVPAIVSGTVDPAPIEVASARCTGPGQSSCLIPCPACGDGLTEFPETCDDGGTVSCDGCSLFCQQENCNDGEVCTEDLCDPGMGCLNVPGAAGTVCRPAVGACDVAETCTGSLPSCPPDQLEPAGKLCRAPAGVCDEAEVCSGSSPACPADALKPAGTVCRAAAAECDAEETCTGSTATCPPDALQPPGTACDDGDACTRGETCDAGGSCGGGVSTCGDGFVQTMCGEECDDGGSEDGDGCSSACTVEPCFVCAGEPSVCSPDTGAACDDGNLCTIGDACDPSGACAGEERPRDGCRQPTVPRKGLLVVKDKKPDSRDIVIFKWLSGASTSKSDFADPIRSTTYGLCIYDESGGSPGLVLGMVVPPGGVCDRGKPCWGESAAGFKYKDRRGSQQGLQVLRLKGGPSGKAKIMLKARGEALLTPQLPLDQDPAVTVQLVKDDGLCWSARFSGPAKKNSASTFKDLAD